MDGVDNSVGAEEPYLVAPFLWVALGILGIVVVDEVLVFDVDIECRIERCAGVKRHRKQR